MFEVWNDIKIITDFDRKMIYAIKNKKIIARIISGNELVVADYAKIKQRIMNL